MVIGASRRIYLPASARPTGDLTIPGFGLDWNGQMLSTDPISIPVSQAGISTVTASAPSALLSLRGSTGCRSIGKAARICLLKLNSISNRCMWEKQSSSFCVSITTACPLVSPIMNRLIRRVLAPAGARFQLFSQRQRRHPLRGDRAHHLALPHHTRPGDHRSGHRHHPGGLFSSCAQVQTDQSPLRSRRCRRGARRFQRGGGPVRDQSNA